MRVRPVCKMAAADHLESASQLSAKAAVPNMSDCLFSQLVKWLPAALWFASGGRRASRQLLIPFAGQSGRSHEVPLLSLPAPCSCEQSFSLVES